MDGTEAGWRRRDDGSETFAAWLTHQGPGLLDERDDDELRERDRRFVAWRCSVCGHLLGDHLVDESGEHTVFACPQDPGADEALPAAERLGETGQTRH